MSGNGITPHERVRIRHHMAFMNVAEAATFVLGSPAAVETSFLIEPAMDKVLVEAVPELRRILGVLDRIEAQKVEDLEVLVVTKVGSIDINGSEQSALDREYAIWQGKLSNLLGVPANPFDRSGTGCVNVPVLHG